MTATYYRVSSEKQTLEMQKHAISLFLTSKNLKNDITFQDEGYTGGNGNRPGLKQLIEAVNTTTIDFVVIYRLDRLFRSLNELLKVLELFKKRGTKLISVSD